MEQEERRQTRKTRLKIRESIDKPTISPFFVTHLDLSSAYLQLAIPQSEFTHHQYTSLSSTSIDPNSFFYYHPARILFLICFLSVSDLPDDATDLIGEGSVHPSQYDEEKFNWLLHLDVDKDTTDYQAATPVSVQSTIPSTPALPEEVVGSEYTDSPARFSPEPEEIQGDELEGTISDKTYDDICKQPFLLHQQHFIIIVYFFFSIFDKVDYQNRN